MPMINRREIPVKRDEVHGWLTEYNAVENPSQDLSAFINSKLEEKSLTDITVDMGDPYGALTLQQIIMEEVESGSYGEPGTN